MEPGKMEKLTVERVSDIGYILTNRHNPEDELLLHFNDCAGKELNVNDVVEVFVFFDHKGRTAATLDVPKITVFNCDWVEVVDVLTYGVFVNIGTRKDVLLSVDDLPFNVDLWPQVGDLLYAYLLNDNNKGFLLKLAKHEDYLDIKEDAPYDVYGKHLDMRVTRIGKEGINVYTDEGYLGFIHHSEYKSEPRLGEKITARVIDVKSNKEINLSLIPQKEIAMREDYQLILDYLEMHDGTMPLCDKSSPDDIKDLLDISKAAFKRAMGRLLRDKKITQDYLEKETTLIKKNDS